MSSRILLWSIVSALAGFLFGFDTAVISGAEQKIQSLWNLSAGMHGVAIASALYGTVLGSLLGGWPTDRFGRRATLLLIGAIWSALATDVYFFITARVLGGLGLGISTVAAPLTSFFPKMVSDFAPGYVFAFFAGMMVLQLVWVKTIMIETKGASLERIQERLKAT